MSLIVMTDGGIRFDGRTLETQPLGGAETAFAELAQALAARGHHVEVRNNCDEPVTHRGVHWAPLSQGLPAAPDLYIANRGWQLLDLAPDAKRCVFWIHNPAQYLLKLRFQRRLARRKPVIVFSGASHASTYPALGRGGERVIIPYGITDSFCHAAPREPPPPRAVFTSNPLRSLDWLLDIWQARIRPAVPHAELHVFAGAAVYGAAAKTDRMAPVLERAAALADFGVVLRGPVPKPQLVEELACARVFLYRGDEGETFCNAAAESQAMGVPGVVEDIACMSERIRNDRTGYVVSSRDAVADAAVALMVDDGLWRAQHRACLATQRVWGWAEAAREFARLAP
ncbi:MAG: glycosyltransferase [Alphaproteobacteria bacterium]|nr:glycosyltransferase [Alphaproteobacteria bacterium]